MGQKKVQVNSDNAKNKIQENTMIVIKEVQEKQITNNTNVTNVHRSHTKKNYKICSYNKKKHIIVF